MLRKMRRSWLKMLLRLGSVVLATLILLPAIQVLAAPTALWNTFGAKKKISAKGVPKVQGVDAYMTTPDTLIGFGEKTAGPVPVGNYFGPPFIESGAYKECFLGCGYHPYSSYRDVNGNGTEEDRVDINLLPGGWYEYTSFFLGQDIWRTMFCDGSGCHILQDYNLGTSAGVKYAAAGGEGIDTNFGPVTAAAFKWRNRTGKWANACYTEILKNVNGKVTPCGNNFDWTVQFP